MARRTICWRRLPMVVAACQLGLLAWSGTAWALSGEVAVLSGLYTASAESCNVVRAAAGTPLDIIVPCSATARANGARVCDIVTPQANIGLAIGQCADSFPTPLVPVAAGAALETGVQVAGTSMGANTAYVPGLASATPDTDTVCNSFAGTAGGSYDCVKVTPGQCPPGGCAPSCGSVKVFSNNCQEVRSQLATAVTNNPPALSHYWGIDVQQASHPGYLAVGVCAGETVGATTYNFKWECASAAAPLTNVKAYDSLLIATAFTPVCLVTSRLPPICPKK